MNKETLKRKRILSLEEAVELRSMGSRRPMVWTSGSYDLWTFMHTLQLVGASIFGEVWAGVDCDEHVQRNKRGPWGEDIRPWVPQDKRAIVVAGQRAVRHAVLLPWVWQYQDVGRLAVAEPPPEKVGRDLQALRPDFVVVTPAVEKNWQDKMEYLQDLGLKAIILGSEDEFVSSTALARGIADAAHEKLMRNPHYW